MRALRKTLFLMIVTVTYSISVGCNRSDELKVWTPEDHGTVVAIDEQEDTLEPKTPQDNSGQSATFLWQTTCASCHGPNGEGNGPRRPRGFAMPDFTDPAWHKSTTNAQIKHVITYGKGVMPGFGNRIPQSAIEKLSAKVRTFEVTNDVDKSTRTSDE